MPSTNSVIALIGTLCPLTFTVAVNVVTASTASTTYADIAMANRDKGPTAARYALRASRRTADEVHRQLRTQSWWTGEDSNLRSSQGAAGLQPAAINRSATCPVCGPCITSDGESHGRSRALRIITVLREASLECDLLRSCCAATVITP